MSESTKGLKDRRVTFLHDMLRARDTAKVYAKNQSNFSHVEMIVANLSLIDTLIMINNHKLTVKERVLK